MFFHIILTTKCNLECVYCSGEASVDFDDEFLGFDVDYHLPAKLGYDIGLLDAFCRRDPSCVLIFYGGEPLLCIDEIRRIMDGVKAEHFILQTNGLLLDRLDTEYVNCFHTILVSIDGEESLTDYYRGKGVYKKVIDNLKLIRRNGFKGELIARMTVMEQTDIYRQVRWLVENREFPFTSVHWQLNAGFWGKDYLRRNFKKWICESYNPGIRRLTKFWVDKMEETGTMLKLYPLLGIAQSLLCGEEESQLRCGAGWINYAIQTDGQIIPCPTMWGMKNYYLGHIGEADPTKLPRIPIGKPCTKCDILSLCGGRCLYANVTKRWKPEAYHLVCNATKNLIDSITKEMPRIQKLIKTGRINQKQFEYMKYNGCEIIP
ncbi:MAG: TIGR04084 family radical SAM/SPASM domain-containing protein [Candidatus Bathyarchaeia archaeon]